MENFRRIKCFRERNIPHRELTCSVCLSVSLSGCLSACLFVCHRCYVINIRMPEDFMIHT